MACFKMSQIKILFTNFTEWFYNGPNHKSSRNINIYVTKTCLHWLEELITVLKKHTCSLPWQSCGIMLHWVLLNKLFYILIMLRMSLLFEYNSVLQRLTSSPVPVSDSNSIKSGCTLSLTWRVLWCACMYFVILWEIHSLLPCSFCFTYSNWLMWVRLSGSLHGAQVWLM